MRATYSSYHPARAVAAIAKRTGATPHHQARQNFLQLLNLHHRVNQPGAVLPPLRLWPQDRMFRTA
jgi:hypothetical protein